MKPPLMTRLTAPIAGVSLLLLICAVGSAWYVRHTQQMMAGPIATSVASVRAAQELEISIRELLTQVNRYLITGDRKHLEPLPRMKQRTADALAAAEVAGTTPAEQSLMRRVRQGYDHFFTEYDQVLREPPAQGLYLKMIELTDTVLMKEILDPAHEYLRLNEGVLAQASEANQEAADQLTLGLLGLGMFGSAGGLLAGWVLAAAIRRSMLRTEGWLRDTAALLDQAARAEVHGNSVPPPVSALERATVSVSAVLRRLRETERAALRAEQLAWVGQMAAGIAHEIRNPLMAIKLLVQAAADRPEGTGFRARDLRVLEEEIVRLEQIVSGFLDFARPPRPETRPVDVSTLVARTVDGVRARADLQGVTLAVHTPPGPLIARVDPNQLRQVVYNLLFNALDAQPRGGEIRIELDARSSPEDGGRELILHVVDTGPGLPVELGDRIFEPFVSTRESGLGLGLSICRRIVESHGGTLGATNRPEGGAAFTARLPLAGVDPINSAVDGSPSPLAMG